MVARSRRPEGTWWRKTDERGQDGKLELEGTTATKDEGTTATKDERGQNGKPEVGSTASEGQETSMYPEERQQVTDNNNPVEPLRGQ